MARRSDHSRPELRQMAIEAAARIIATDGLKALSIRRIAAQMGYTSGTLYQLFTNLDALVLEVNIATLSDLHKTLATVAQSGKTEPDLLALAQSYRAFVAQHQNRWNTVFVHTLPEKGEALQRYQQTVAQLVGTAATALLPLFEAEPNAADRAGQEARVLWASLYGIVSLDTAGKLSNFEPIDDIVTSLVRNFVAGLRSKAGDVL